jgi:hypothetical protein
MRKGLLITHDEPVVNIPINPVPVYQDTFTRSDRKYLSSVPPGGKTPVPHEHNFPVSTDQLPMNTTVLGSPWETNTALMYSTTPTLQDVKKLQPYLVRHSSQDFNNQATFDGISKPGFPGSTKGGYMRRQQLILHFCQKGIHTVLIVAKCFSVSIHLILTFTRCVLKAMVQKLLRISYASMVLQRHFAVITRRRKP